MPESKEIDTTGIRIWQNRQFPSIFVWVDEYPQDVDSAYRFHRICGNHTWTLTRPVDEFLKLYRPLTWGYR